MQFILFQEGIIWKRESYKFAHGGLCQNAERAKMFQELIKNSCWTWKFYKLLASNFSIKVVAIYSEIFPHISKVKGQSKFWVANSTLKITKKLLKNGWDFLETPHPNLSRPVSLHPLGAKSIGCWHSTQHQILSSVSSLSLFRNGWGQIWATSACYSSGVSAPTGRLLPICRPSATTNSSRV